LYFVGGGSVQHDEALPNLDMMARNLEEGLDFLWREFGIESVPVAWQIDPFGHSGLTPGLLQSFGYRYLVGSRIDVEIRESLKQDANLEFLWKGSDLGQNTALFTHILPNSYNFPRLLNPQETGNCWDYSRTNPTAWYAICSEDEIVRIIREQQSYFKHDKLLFVYGDDFAFDNYARAKMFFDKNDEVFKAISKRENIKIHWSTPKDYFDAVTGANVKLATYSGDFFPYMCTKKSPDHKYWTGFYSLLPNFKREIYQANELHRFSGLFSGLLSNSSLPSTDLNLCVHHDAITATCRPKVVEYYRSGLDKTVTFALNQLGKVCEERMGRERGDADLYRPAVVYNALNWAREELVRVDSDSQFVEVRDQQQRPVQAQVYMPEGGNDYIVYFQALLPALSLNIFSVVEHDRLCDHCAALSEDSRDLRQITNGQITIHLSESGFPVSISTSAGDVQWRHHFVKFDGRRSGAYIFFPMDEPTTLASHLLSLQVLTGPLFSAAYIRWSRTGVTDNEDSQFILLSSVKPDIVTWEVRTFALGNEEIMLEIESPLASAATPLHTYDSVAWRQRRYLPPRKVGEMGRNFYPVSGAVLLGGKGQGWVVIPYHPLGVGTYDGKYYLHLQRSLKQDDDFGLAHHIQDTSSAVHSFKLILSPQTFPSFPTIYYESKQSNRVLSLSAPFRLSTSSIARSTPTNDRFANYALSLGLNNPHIYLSSVSPMDARLVAKVLNLRESGQNVDWPGWQLGSKLQGNRRSLFTPALEWQGSAETVCAFHCEHSTVVDLYGEVEGSQGEFRLKAKELATFVLERVSGKVVEEEISVPEATEPVNEPTEPLHSSPEPTPPLTTPLEEPKTPIKTPLEETIPFITTLEEPKLPIEETPAPVQDSKSPNSSLFSPVSSEPEAPIPFLPPPAFQPLEISEAIARLEYSVICSLGLLSTGALCLYLRNKKYRSE